MNRTLPLRVWWQPERTFNLDDPYDKRRYYEIVLREGTSDDIRALDLDDLHEHLDELWLPTDVRRLWEDFFKWRESHGAR